MNPTFRLACDLIAQASVTPDDRQCQQIIRSLLAAAGSVALVSLAPSAANPPTSPLEWPALHPLMLAIAALVAAPAFLTQPPRHTGERTAA